MEIQVFTIWYKSYICVNICCILYMHMDPIVKQMVQWAYPYHYQMVHLGLFRGMRPYYKVAAHCAHCVFNHLLAIYICCNMQMLLYWVTISNGIISLDIPLMILIQLMKTEMKIVIRDWKWMWPTLEAFSFSAPTKAFWRSIKVVINVEKGFMAI